MAARAHRHFPARPADSRAFLRPRLRFRRRSLDHPRRHRIDCACARSDRVSLSKVYVARRRRFCRKSFIRDALSVRRAHRKEVRTLGSSRVFGTRRQKAFLMSMNHLDMNPEAAPCVMVIFGATGDLTKRKLIPALCNLAQDKLLPEQFAIVGFATNDYTTESFRKMLGAEIPKYAPTPVDLKFWDGIAERINYVRGDFQDTEAYIRLKNKIYHLYTI